MKIRFSPDANRQRIATVQSGILTTKPVILNDVGAKLVGLAGIYFDALAGGGTGFTGRKWAAPKAATVARREAMARRGQLRATVAMQGIVSGRLRQSLKYQVSGDSVSVSYDDPKAKYFNIHRRLIPSRMPNVWRDKIEAIAQADLTPTVKGPQ